MVNVQKLLIVLNHHKSLLSSTLKCYHFYQAQQKQKPRQRWQGPGSNSKEKWNDHQKNKSTTQKSTIQWKGQRYQCLILLADVGKGNWPSCINYEQVCLSLWALELMFPPWSETLKVPPHFLLLQTSSSFIFWVFKEGVSWSKIKIAIDFEHPTCDSIAKLFDCYM